MKQDTIDFRRKLSEHKRLASIKQCIWGELNELEKCNGRIIKAHSIQRSKILHRISTDGIISCFSLEGKIDETIDPIAEEGIGKFSTFTGFCQHHDKSVFSVIEDNSFSGSVDQIYTYAFRACAKEYHTIKEQALMIERSLRESYHQLSGDDLDLIERRYIFSGYKIAEKRLADNKISHNELQKACHFLQQQIIGRNFTGIETYYRSFDKEFPIAANSCFIPYHDTQGNPLISQDEINQLNKSASENPLTIPFVMFNIFPEGGKTHILFSHFSKAPPYSNLSSLFAELSELDLLQAISNIIVNYCENVAISPKYLTDNFPGPDQKIINDIFCSNLIMTSEYKPIPFSLFKI
jgi:hypothetical protein